MIQELGVDAVVNGYDLFRVGDVADSALFGDCGEEECTIGSTKDNNVREVSLRFGHSSEYMFNNWN